MKFLCALCALCSLVFPAYALDRGAFTFTNYDLNVRVEPEQQRLAVRGKITLQNGSAVPQKNLVLQISSTLDWKSIQFGGKTVQFVTHEYTSDIDHTGTLSEAVVSLPREVQPKGTIDLEIGYEGTVPLDVTRLTRIGIAEEKAKHSDWDQISKSFTAVRGIGYVAWYPVATEAANLSEGSSVEDVVAQWKARQATASMSIRFESTSPQPIFFSGEPSQEGKHKDTTASNRAAFSLASSGMDVPTFVISDYQKLRPNDQLVIYYLPGQEESAKDYGEVVAQVDPIIPAASGSGNPQILGLPDPDAASFVTGDMWLTPLRSELTNEAELSIVYAKARQASSPRAWIREGLAHYAQVAFIEKQQGRQAALNYLDAHASALIETENAAAGKPNGHESVGSLTDAPDGLSLQTKAMYVWWMLKDMSGDMLMQVLTSYRAIEDKDPAYLQRLVEKATRRDLQWFFDDWVYHDRGLPEFRVDAVFASPLEKGGFLVTVTVENLGNAGAEVPVILKIEGGEIRRQLEVRGKSKASVRIEAASAPQEVTVNDGSVPEGDRSNNTYKVQPRDTAR